MIGSIPKGRHTGETGNCAQPLPRFRISDGEKSSMPTEASTNDLMPKIKIQDNVSLDQGYTKQAICAPGNG